MSKAATLPRDRPTFLLRPEKIRPEVEAKANRKPIYECRCNGRLQTKRFTRLSHRPIYTTKRFTPLSFFMFIMNRESES